MAEAPASRDVGPPVLLSESAAREAMIAWFRGEFAAANAIIDALCGHLIEAFGSDYEAVMAAIHRRRLNWIPVLQMQKYHPIVEVTTELRKAREMMMEIPQEKTEIEMDENFPEKARESDEIGGVEAIDDDSPSSDITDSGSGEEEKIRICWKHDEDCESRASLLNLTKRFTAKEHVRGHRVNVVKGLKLYEDVFTKTQLSKLSDFVGELREAGRNRNLSGETFVLFNKNTKGNKRELIQLGVPIFGHAKDEHSVSIEPIPPLLHDVIDHLLQWRLIPQYKRPNGCVINFFDEEEHSQPFQKPPHVDQPISTLLLSDSTMVFGHRLGVDNDGSFRGSLTLSLKEGSLLVMRGNSAEMARHVTCPSPTKRVAITFFKLKPDSNNLQQPPSPTTALRRPTTHALFPHLTPDLCVSAAAAAAAMVIRTPMGMLPPATPSTFDASVGTGTGVFLPWTAPPRKPGKHLPPRAQRLRLLSSAVSVGDHETTTAEVGVK